MHHGSTGPSFVRRAAGSTEVAIKAAPLKAIDTGGAVRIGRSVLRGLEHGRFSCDAGNDESGSKVPSTQDFGPTEPRPIGPDSLSGPTEATRVVSRVRRP